MKQVLKKSSILFLLNLFCLIIPAQEPQNTLATNDLVLEVTYLKGNSPVSQRIGENSASKTGAWYSLFRKIPDWQPKSGELPVRAVKVVPYFEGALVKISVSVFTGEKFHDNEIFIADVKIRENERKAVSELAGFGVEPFELVVVRKVPTTAFLPTVINKTASLQVMIEPNFSVLPSFNVKLLNNSNKAVSAYAFETMSGNQKQLSGMPQGEEGQSLIAPYEIFETTVGNTGQNLTLLISALIFEDGSYEGDPQTAAMFRAFVTGRKILLKQSVSLWHNAAAGKNPIDDLNELLERLSALNPQIDENLLTELFKKFPALSEKEKDNLRIGAQVAIKGTRREMLGELQEFISKPDKTDESIKTWLTESNERYKNWLTRLTP